MKVWVIITSSIISLRYEQRKAEYIAGIKSILNLFKSPKYNVVIVENNTKIQNLSFRSIKTFLNDFNIPVLYTKNNLILNQTKNYGIPEMLDLFGCIKYFNIQDDDFIIKVTGRYVIDQDSPFFKIVDNLETKPYSAIVRYNQFDNSPSLVKSNNCVTGLIGLKCKYLKQIQLPPFDDISISIEMKWAQIINSLDDSEICILDILGINIKPKVLWDCNYLHI